MCATDHILIAIVDDDESVCRALRRLVRSLGMDAQTFASGQTFLELLETLPSFQPSCLVLDMQMPGMNGLEVLHRLREKHRDLPVVFITAHDEGGVRERAMADGAIAYLRKPFNEETFIDILQATLGVHLPQTNPCRPTGDIPSNSRP